MKKIKREFFLQPTLKVAKEILGKKIVRKIDSNKLLSGIILEVEAYIGPEGLATHARMWKITKRNFIEYAQGGFLYVYLVYGYWWQLNITTYKSGTPECILIRAFKPDKGIELMKKFRKESNLQRLADGPGKVCEALKIDGSFNQEDLIKSKRIWIEEGIKVKKIYQSERIGIDYAGPYWSKKKWRFYIKI